ncbi:C-type lectin domain family 12 member A-like isoform X2 [Sphaeramia orbicularis]|uniref:C-type lectin domain family 12 member A-like isoform X2 n=1 Tax=Sphaeramia orbicularis TaxID=375764 RepID=UPI00117CFD24|nr:C-type lectin domain family 12 member A-like isoform X2 [Sphaeramia orbicularis]
MEMEEIYENIDEVSFESSKPSVNEKALQVSNRGLHGAVILLGLFCGFLMVGLISLGVHSAGLSSAKANLTKSLQISDNKILSLINHLGASYIQISNLTEGRARLNITLNNVRQELERLRAEKPCGKGWKRFGGSCYFLSNDIASWKTGRNYCRNSGGDLVIVNSKEEQVLDSRAA